MGWDGASHEKEEITVKTKDLQVVHQDNYRSTLAQSCNHVQTPQPSHSHKSAFFQGVHADMLAETQLAGHALRGSEAPQPQVCGQRDARGRNKSDSPVQKAALVNTSVGKCDRTGQPPDSMA